MGRVLLIAIACVIGALIGWLFMPTVQPAPVKRDMPVFEPNAERAEKEDTTVPWAMSSEKRRARAEQLIGKPLKFIAPDVVHSEAWYGEQGKQVIERAMDECYLLLEYHQYAHDDAPEEYAEDTADEAGWDEAGWEEQLSALTNPATTKQMKNCLNVYRAYHAMHGRKFEF